MTNYRSTMELQEIDDRIRIHDLLVRYSEALCRGDWETWSTCFVPDAVVDYTTAGGIAGTPAEAATWLDTTMALFDMRIHRVANVQICFDGPDQAALSSQYTTTMRIAGSDGGAATYIDAAGWYDDVAVRTGSGWQLNRRVERLAFVRM